MDMDSMYTTTMTGMDSTATAAASTDHSDMDMTTSSHDSMMMSIFFSSTDTALYSESFAPNSPGAYAGMCIFLVILAMILRVLLASKAYLEQRWLDAELKRRYIVVAGKSNLGESLSSESVYKGGNAVVSSNGMEENVKLVERKRSFCARPWRFSVDPVRACLDVVIAAVGYLLWVVLLCTNSVRLEADWF